MDETTTEVEKVKSADELAEEAAEKTVGDTKKQLGDNGDNAQAAYAKLIESVSSNHNELDKSDPSGKAAKAYDQKVLASLEKDGLMPELALEYGSRVTAYKSVDADSDGRITATELTAFKKTGNLGAFGNAMVDQLIKDSDSIRGTKADSSLPGFSISDLNASRATHQVVNKNEHQEKNARKEADALESFLFDKRNGVQLFSQADFAGARGDVSKIDTRVGKSDFEALLGKNILSQSEKNELQERVLNKWDDPAFKSRYLDKDGFMTPGTFKRATGAEASAIAKQTPQDAAVKANPEAERNNAVADQAIELSRLLSKEVKGSKATVWQYADFAGSPEDRQRTDNFVSKHDLQELLKTPGFDPSLAQQIKTQLIEKMDTPEFKQNFMSGEYLDQSKIAKAIGASSSADVEQAEVENRTKIADSHHEEVRVHQIAGQRAAATELAHRLVKDDGPNKSTILERADSAGSQSPDGLVNDKDFAKLLLDPSLSSQDRKFVEQELIAKWNTPEVKLLRKGGDYISVDSLKSLLPNGKNSLSNS